MHKALYGLKKAPWAWYEELHSYLVKIGFERTSDKNNLYLRCDSSNEILIDKIFFDDIIFGGNEIMSKSFSEEMRNEFEMSIIGEIKFFIRLQIKQVKDGIYIAQSKCIKEIIKTFNMEDSKLVGTPMTTSCKLSKEDDAKEVNETLHQSMIGKI